MWKEKANPGAWALSKDLPKLALLQYLVRTQHGTDHTISPTTAGWDLISDHLKKFCCGARFSSFKFLQYSLPVRVWSTYGRVASKVLLYIPMFLA